MAGFPSLEIPAVQTPQPITRIIIITTTIIRHLEILVGDITVAALMVVGIPEADIIKRDWPFAFRSFRTSFFISRPRFCHCVRRQSGCAGYFRKPE